MKYLLLLIMFMTSTASALEQPECLDDAAVFWQRIYTEFGENDIVIHDEDTLEIVATAKIAPKSNQRLRKRNVQEALDTARAALPEATLRAQNGVKELFQKGVERAKVIAPKVRKALQKEDMPEILVFLPHVESAYHSSAGSRVGAQGLWQIMPATARMFTKKHRSALKNIDFSTRLAILILQHNYEETGDWLLAINAYHSGLGRIKKGVKQTGSTDVCELIENYEDAGYQFASRNYLAQLFAVKNILQPK